MSARHHFFAHGTVLLALLALLVLLALPPASAAECPASAQWLEPAHATAHYDAPQPPFGTELQRYTNAMKVDFALTGGVHKAILALDRSPELIFGSGNPAEFLDAQLSALLPVIYLLQHYPNPCTTPAADDFAFRIEHDTMTGGGAAQVSGTLRRTDNRIDYTLHVTPAAPAAKAPLDVSGSWTILPLAVIPEDTDVRGANVVVGLQVVAGAAPATVAEARRFGQP